MPPVRICSNRSHDHHHPPQPACGTSRNTHTLIREAGIEPVVVEYLKTPRHREAIRALAGATGQPLRRLLREKGVLFAELGLGDPVLAEEQILDAIAAHPMLLNRPIVVTPLGTRLCRPSGTVLALLPPQSGRISGEDGEGAAPPGRA